MKFMAARKQTNTLLKNMDKYEGEAAINYGAPAQVLKALRKMGFTASKLKSTDDRSLKISSEHPSWDMKKSKKEDPQLEKVGVIDTVRLYRETGQLLKSYEDWIKDYKNPITGLFHSRIDLLGAATGRTSSSNPNVQNIPKGSDWRSCFVCPEGYVVATLDYSGCELRILAEYSQEKAFLDAFLKDWDVHSVGAEIIFGKKWKDAAEAGCAYYTDHQKCKCKGHKELRDQIKAINFGIAYGMEAKKLSETVEITEDEAKELLKVYRAAFPTLIKYLEASGKSATMKFEARTLAQRRRLFHKPLWQEAVAKAILKLKDKGIVGQAPNSKQISSAYKAMYSAIEREGKNTPIQGSNADMAKIAAGCGFDKSGKGFMWHELEPKVRW
jgi:DNA polymerase-1